jgi:glutamate racemase
MVAQTDPDLGAVFKKRRLTLVVTDSGLGGLAVMEDVAGKIKDSGCFRNVSLVFVNALFDENVGYNALRTRKEKADMFDRVLKAIDERYHPDAILVGCNTLSVILDDTFFSEWSDTPVIGIVDAGIQLINDELKADTSSRVIIFGTETTIEEESHRKGLLELGTDNERIITKACPQLQSYIEQNPLSEETEMLIAAYMNEALEGLDESDGRVHISLNCSHYGYSESLWSKAIEESSFRKGRILNPNSHMGDFLSSEKCRRRYNNPKNSFLVVSKVRMPNAVTISSFFQENSPEMAEALKNYTLVPDLF